MSEKKKKRAHEPGRNTLLAMMAFFFLAFFLLALGRGRRMVMPFGPFLALGAYISYLCCDGLWQWYWELML